MVSRCERVLDDDRVVDVTTERRDDLQAERLAGGWLTTRRGEHDQPARSFSGFPGRRPQVAQQGADDPEQEQVDETEEQETDGPQHEQEAVVHQSGAPATSTTSAVSPTSRRSPTPSTTSVTGTPLTRDPLVLPRSA